MKCKAFIWILEKDLHYMYKQHIKLDQHLEYIDTVAEESKRVCGGMRGGWGGGCGSGRREGVEQGEMEETHCSKHHA